MHTVQASDDGVWTIGYCSPNGVWQPLEDYGTWTDACAMVSYLNGGLHPFLTDRLLDALKIGGAFSR